MKQQWKNYNSKNASHERLLRLRKEETIGDKPGQQTTSKGRRAPKQNPIMPYLPSEAPNHAFIDRLNVLKTISL